MSWGTTSSSSNPANSAPLILFTLVNQIFIFAWPMKSLMRQTSLHCAALTQKWKPCHPAAVLANHRHSNAYRGASVGQLAHRCTKAIWQNPQWLLLCYLQVWRVCLYVLPPLDICTFSIGVMYKHHDAQLIAGLSSSLGNSYIKV